MLGLLLLQVLASCLWLGQSEVVDSFDSCPQFFYAAIPPNDALNPNSPAWICQHFNHSYHYATLYDKEKRIPVYSAYKYEPGSGTRRDFWFVEPQLINPGYSKDMATETYIENNYHITLQQIGQNQAVTQDYQNLQGLDRGQLCPFDHQSGDNSKMATFTLTNIVPQNSILHGGAWKEYEYKTMGQNTQGCKTTYVITGAVPGNTYISNNRVNLPSHIWSAACCLGAEEPTKAWGAIAENDMNEVTVYSLRELEEKLSKLYSGKTVTLFDDDCPRD
ncbi:endonuclease domain-containing 1 protein-like [Melospiza georgiana]|uniref:endonuclease domain-containing 1 protein-like n=1 Tax=Melospiza georgiana TaxID=44398 RepID=UPI0025AC16B3|nr:endonuclease domain-containing 1 protein-like [Melospiza georgiana]